MMSHVRKNSARDKGTGKKWIYLERYTLHRVWAISQARAAPWYGVVSFYRGGYFHRLMNGRNIPATLGKGWGFPGIGPPPTF